MLKLKLQYFGYLMWRTDSLEKILKLERLKVGGEGDDRGWDGWMASSMRWAWVWIGSGSWWWTGKPGLLQSMGSQRVGHNWMTKLRYKLIPNSYFIPPLQQVSLNGTLKPHLENCRHANGDFQYREEILEIGFLHIPNVFKGKYVFLLNCCSVSQSCLTLGTPWTAAHQASLCTTNSQRLLKLMAIESVTPSSHLILISSHPTFNLSTIRVFSNKSVLLIR